MTSYLLYLGPSLEGWLNGQLPFIKRKTLCAKIAAAYKQGLCVEHCSTGTTLMSSLCLPMQMKCHRRSFFQGKLHRQRQRRPWFKAIKSFCLTLYIMNYITHKLADMTARVRAQTHKHTRAHIYNILCVRSYPAGRSQLARAGYFPPTAEWLGAATVKLPILQVLQSRIWRLTINRA